MIDESGGETESENKSWNRKSKLFANYKQRLSYYTHSYEQCHNKVLITDMWWKYTSPS